MRIAQLSRLNSSTRRPPSSAAATGARLGGCKGGVVKHCVHGLSACDQGAGECAAPGARRLWARVNIAQVRCPHARAHHIWLLMLMSRSL